MWPTRTPRRTGRSTWSVCAPGARSWPTGSARSSSRTESPSRASGRSTSRSTATTSSAGLPKPEIGPTDLPEPIEGRTVVLVDDVLFTGRTIRAAMDVLADYGRPRAVKLAALVDRAGASCPSSRTSSGSRVQTDGGRVGAGDAVGARRARPGRATRAARMTHVRATPPPGHRAAHGRRIWRPSSISASASWRSTSAPSRRCRRCAGRRSSTCSSRRRRAPAPRSRSPPSGCRPTPSTSRARPRRR